MENELADLRKVKLEHEQLVKNGQTKTEEMTDLKAQMNSMREQVDMMTRMLTATHDGKAKPAQLVDHPELKVWKMSDKDASETLGVPIENIKRAKQKLREIAEQKTKKVEGLG
jgi:hypothetical protein